MERGFPSHSTIQTDSTLPHASFSGYLHGVFIAPRTSRIINDVPLCAPSYTRPEMFGIQSFNPAAKLLELLCMCRTTFPLTRNRRCQIAAFSLVKSIEEPL